MPTPFLSSTPGRLLLTAAGLYLLSNASYLLWGNLTIFGWGLPAAITLSFVAVGLGMGDYTKQTLLAVVLLPPVLWGFMYLTGEFHFSASRTVMGTHFAPNPWGYGIALLGAIALGRAALGGGQDAEASKA